MSPSKLHYRLGLSASALIAFQWGALGTALAVLVIFYFVEFIHRDYP